jgi:hypothetical protein
VPRPVFKTGLAGITLAGEFDSLPPPPLQSVQSPDGVESDLREL